METTATFQLSTIEFTQFGFTARLYLNRDTGIWTANFPQPLVSADMNTVYAYEQFLSYVVWYLQELNK